MRLFIATPIKLKSYDKIKGIFRKYIKGKWVEEQNLHLTHLFIGDDEPEKYMINFEIPDEKIELKKLSLFKDRIFHVSCHSKHIYKANRFFTKKFNIKGRFTPHITLCRIKEKKSRELLSVIEDFGELNEEVDFELYLYSSTLTPQGPIYKKIFKY